MGGWAGLAQGIGSGLNFGIQAKDQREERALRDRQLASVGARGAGQPSTPGTGGTPPFMPTDGSGRPGGARGAIPAFYSAERSADASAGAGAGAKDPTFWGLLAKREGAGNFSTLYGHSQKEGGKFAGVDVTKMTLRELSDFQRPEGEYGQWVKSQVGRVATPAGGAQIVGTTGRSVAKEMGLSQDTLFNEGTQRTMATYLAQQRLSRAKTPEGKRAGLRAEWEGFKSVTDSDLDRVIQELEA